jgi:hypothetical protein
MSKWAQASSTWNKLHALAALNQVERLAKFKRGLISDSASAVGDASELYAQAALDARCGVRFQSGVVRELRSWERTLDSHQRNRNVPRACVDKQTYHTIFVKVCLAMTRKATLQEIEEIVTEDWEHDSRGRPSISVEQFKDSLFECRARRSNRAPLRTLPVYPPAHRGAMHGQQQRQAQTQLLVGRRQRCG